MRILIAEDDAVSRTILRRSVEKLNERLFQESREAPLTHLGNRLRLEEDLDVLQARSRRYGHSYAMALCDVDLFKAYNDRYGHPAGDRALEEVAGPSSATAGAATRPTATAVKSS